MVVADVWGDVFLDADSVKLRKKYSCCGLQISISGVLITGNKEICFSKANEHH